MPLPMLAGFWQHFRDAVWRPWKESDGARLCQCAGFGENEVRRERLHLHVLGSLSSLSLLILERDMVPSSEHLCVRSTESISPHR